MSSGQTTERERKRERPLYFAALQYDCFYCRTEADKGSSANGKDWEDINK